MPLEPVPFEEAIRIFKDKVPMSSADFAVLSHEMKLRAFAMAGVTHAEVLKDVQGEMVNSIENGTTYQTFRDTFRDRMQDLGWAGKARWRLQTTFRTNIQSAFNAGHFEQQVQVAEDFPFWQYVAVKDKRTRPHHFAMDGKVFPSNHPFWANNYPPNGYNCRCTVRAMTDSQAQKISPKNKPEHFTNVADKGFEGNPGNDFRIDPGKYPDWLANPLKAIQLKYLQGLIAKAKIQADLKVPKPPTTSDFKEATA